MFAVYCYEISMNVYIFDTELEARVCYSLLEALSGYDNNGADLDIIFMDEAETYEELKAEQIDTLSSCQEKHPVYLIYKGETEAVYA